MGPMLAPWTLLSGTPCMMNEYFPDSKVHRANMGPRWVLSAPDGPHVCPMNLAIRVVFHGDVCQLPATFQCLDITEDANICFIFPKIESSRQGLTAIESTSKIMVVTPIELVTHTLVIHVVQNIHKPFMKKIQCLSRCNITNIKGKWPHPFRLITQYGGNQRL